jgi:hypothetical protein
MTTVHEKPFPPAPTPACQAGRDVDMWFDTHWQSRHQSCMASRLAFASAQSYSAYLSALMVHFPAMYAEQLASPSLQVCSLITGEQKGKNLALRSPPEHLRHHILLIFDVV